MSDDRGEAIKQAIWDALEHTDVDHIVTVAQGERLYQDIIDTLILRGLV